MVEKFLASEVRKVTSAPILETRSMDSTNEDVTMIDAGPSKTLREIDHSICAHVDDTTGAGQPEFAHVDSATPENQDINTAGKFDSAAARNNNTGLGGNIGDSSHHVFHAVSDAEHLGTTTIPPEADNHAGSSDLNSRPETDSSNTLPNSLEKDLDDEPEYEVERIGTWYFCKFVGYADEDWAHENDMNNCDHLLKEFYWLRRTESESEKEQPKRKKRKSKPDCGGPVPPNLAKKPKKRKEKCTYIAGLSLNHTEHLSTLMSSDQLALEVQHVQDSRPTKEHASTAFFSAMASPMLISNILELCYSQSQVLMTLEHVIDNKQSSQLAIATAEFTKLTSSATVLTQAPTFEPLRWTSACAHIVVYRWCATVGPNMVKDLFELHCSEGFAGFAGNHALGLMVDHIVQHICDTMKRNPSKHIHPTVRHRPFGPIVLGDLTRILGGLYELLDKGGKQHNLTPIKLPDPPKVQLYAAC
ncbi:hypothetical protein C8R45DRAFT_941388 [Mycena sanguinolenta]|nr:hypothetical protein C8R45DRAFT_941388 [Mycena sanguinolenta]